MHIDFNQALIMPKTRAVIMLSIHHVFYMHVYCMKLISV